MSTQPVQASAVRMRVAKVDSPRSVVFDQAENRLHVQKAILLILLGGGTRHFPARSAHA